MASNWKTIEQPHRKGPFCGTEHFKKCIEEQLEEHGLPPIFIFESEKRRVREGAEIIRGHAECSKKMLELLEEHGLPAGLFPLEIQELVFNRADGFVWIQHKEKVVHNFKKLDRPVSYVPNITGFLEKGKLRNLTGVKTNELMSGFAELYVDPSNPGKIVLKSSTGLSDEADVDAFAIGE